MVARVYVSALFIFIFLSMSRNRNYCIIPSGFAKLDLYGGKHSMEEYFPASPSRYSLARYRICQNLIKENGKNIKFIQLLQYDQKSS